MYRLIALFTVFLVAGCARNSQPFYLRSLETGLISQPLSPTAFGTTTPDRRYLIDRPRSGEMATVEKLKSIVLPHIDIFAADVTSAVAIINDLQSKVVDDPVVISVDLAGYRNPEDLEPSEESGYGAEAFPGFGQQAKPAEIPFVSMRASDIPLFELLQFISLTTNLQLTIEKNKVVLSQMSQNREIPTH